MANMSSLNGFTLTTGFFEEGAATAAGQTNTVGGLSKATLNVPGWFNSVKSCTAATINDDLTALYQQCNQFSPFGDVNAIIVNSATFSAYKAALFANERFMSSDKLDGGRLQLAFAGAVMEQDNEMPANSGGAANIYSAYLLNFEGIKMVFHSDGDFAVSPFEFISGTTARSAQVYLKAQLIADHLRGSGVLTGL